MSTDAHAEAFKTLIAAATQAPCYDHDEAQALGASLPAQYTVLYLSRRFGGVPRLDGTADAPLRRLQTRAVARSITNGRLLEDRTHDAFMHATVDLGGGVVAHPVFESGETFDFDEGYYSALTSWTYAV